MPDANRIRWIMEAGRAILADTDPSGLLLRALELGREVTGARSAAAGVLTPDRFGIDELLTSGAEDQARWMGATLHDALRIPIDDVRPVRIDDLATHPGTQGRPLGNPPMTSFLAVPVVLAGKAWAVLYLTEKENDEPFTQEDEDLTGRLADWVALAIENGLLYRDARTRQAELSRVNRGLTTTTSLTRALAGETDIQRIVDLVVTRAQTLVDARAAVLWTIERDEIVIAGIAGDVRTARVGMRRRIDASLAAEALRLRRPRHVDANTPDGARLVERTDRSALIVPLIFRERAVGLLAVFDPPGELRRFPMDEETVLEAYAASAATALATALSATEEALRKSIRASESERRRWARELHDETLQELAALRVMLSGARRHGDAQALEDAVDQGLALITDGIANLRSLITDLRPAALDELGTQPALEALAARVRAQSEIEIEMSFGLSYERGVSGIRHDADIEATVYRIVQEALTNVTKHAGASHAAVEVVESDGWIDVTVRDDGHGFHPSQRSDGFGLVGMRERIALVEGRLEVSSAPGEGTEVRARVPALRRFETAL